ncbi:unnamed protein product [Caenorhabditis auriculariae]|uniref:Uncharacterized protein n=1 Tax=Caenorhabditis auriculariae TaxID=2777116 RepID=A0A8S1HJR8_9PELO|nr:unnamed protein product [Caenorhabditis auriculariae]
MIESAAVEWASSGVLVVGVVSILLTIFHLIHTTLNPPQCCRYQVTVGSPRPYQNPLKYVRLSNLQPEVDHIHKEAFPVFDV